MSHSDSWNSQNSTELYGVEAWGNSYFKVGEEGHLHLQVENSSPSLDLFTLVTDLRERGIRSPMLLRFPNIVKARIELLAQCFSNAIHEYGYKGIYSGAYPIKVNQQRHLLEEVIKFGQPHGLGLECGSKPELLIALGLLDGPDSFIICNGFKDFDYIETALLSQKLGHQTFVVVDRFEEIQTIIDVSKKLNLVPNIGLRIKLSARGDGKWGESSGGRSKFGLNSPQVISAIELLEKENLTDSVKLVHFHIGSQIPSIQSIKASIKEGGRFFTELYGLGLRPDYIDVGGGLGVDYDGSKTSESSTNYSEQEYANDVVSMIQSICDEKEVPHPHIISESGRSLVAHSSMLVFDILGVNQAVPNLLNNQCEDKDSQIVKDLWDIYENVSSKNINEFYNDLIEKKRDIKNLFSYGVLNLKQRAKADELYQATAIKISKLSSPQGDTEDIYWALEKELSDTYFCNFSIFQSLPDSWALGQVFPVMPIHRLNERPSARTTLVDLTCDSDGKIDTFIDIDEGSTQKYLEVHKLKKNEPYFLGVFLTGAYQETLGDLHNLFGDTDAVHVTMTDHGYSIDHVVQGDSVSEVLEYVQYEKPHLIEKIRQSCEMSIQKELLTPHEARLLMKHYVDGLDSYTYLDHNDR